MKPSENSSEDEALPGLETDLAAGKLFALDVWSELDEFADALGRGVIEDEREFRIILIRASEVVELALTGEASPLACGNAAGENVTTIIKSDRNMVYCAFAGRSNASHGSDGGRGGLLGLTFPRSAGVMPRRASRLEI